MALLSTKEDTNFARVAQIILNLFPQVIRDHLASIVDPTTLTYPAKFKKNPKVKLSNDQISIVNRIQATGDYGECDTTLLYYLFRNVQGVKVTPTSGWAHKVKGNHLGPGDDLERIRILRNEMLGHADKASLCDQDYTDFLQAAEQVLDRFDNCHGNSYAPYNGTGTYVKELKNIERKVMDNTFNTYKQDLLVLLTKEQAIENRVQAVEASLQANKNAVETQISSVEKNLKDHQVATEVSFQDFETRLQENATQMLDVKNVVNDYQESTDTRIQNLRSTLQETGLRISDVESNIKTNEMATKIRFKNIEETFEATDNQTQQEIQAIRERIEMSLENHSAGQDKSQCSNRVDVLPLESQMEESRTPVSHCYQIDNHSWYAWCHHSQLENPSKLLHSFDYKCYIPEEISYQLYENGNTQNFTLEKLNTKFLSKFYEMFDKEIDSQPWLFTNVHQDCISDERFRKLCTTFEKWATVEAESYSFLFIDYDYKENLRQLKYDIKQLKKKLCIKSKIKPSNRILVYLGQKKTIFNVRYLNLESSDDIKSKIEDEIKNGQDDLKLFSALHMESLKTSGITFVSLLVVDGVLKDKFGHIICEVCCKDLVLDANDIMDINHLNKKLRSIIRQCLERSEREITTEAVKNTFESTASKVWASLSVRDVHLPNLSNRGQNTLVRIYLNKHQRLFLHAKFNHSILRGGYGSGKSILAQVKFKELINKADANDVLYFLCFSNDTLYINMVKAHIEGMIPLRLHDDQVTIMNVDEYANKYHLIGPWTISVVLNSLLERHMGMKLSVVLDEVDGSSLSKEEGASIKLYLPQVSYLLFVMQSLEVTRKLVSRINILQRAKTVYDAHNFESTGMKVITLHLIMRNTTKINALSRVATKEFEKHTNKYYERISDEKTTRENVIVDDKRTSSVKLAQLQSSEPIENAVETTNSQAYKRQSAYFVPYGSNYNPYDSKDYQVDHVMKIVSFNCQNYSANTFKSNFHFPGEWGDGHSVTGFSPKLIYPLGKMALDYGNVNTHEVKSRLYLTLHELLQIEGCLGELSIISSDPIDAQLLFEVIRTMGYPVVLYAPALHLISHQFVDDLSNLLRTHFLITDHLGARGMEFKRLLVTFNPYEQYTSQYFIEAFTRAIFELTFLVIYKKANTVKENKNVCKSIIKKWAKEKLVEEIKVDSCKSHLSDTYQLPPYCKDTKENSNVYQIHSSHEKFDICKQIENIVEPVVDVEQALFQLNCWTKEKQALPNEAKGLRNLRQKYLSARSNIPPDSRVVCGIVGEGWVLNKDILLDIDIDGETVQLLLPKDTRAYTSPMMLHLIDALLVCFSINSRDTFQRIKTFWLDDIAKHFPDIPLLLVGTDSMSDKSERGLQEREVTNTEGRSLADEINAVKYFECSLDDQFQSFEAVFEIATLIGLASRGPS